jgi:hypothetical protein
MSSPTGAAREYCARRRPYRTLAAVNATTAADLGNQAKAEKQRTQLDTWVLDNNATSETVSMACVEAAKELGLPETLAPSRKGVDDMRGGRFYPSIEVVLLIERATSGQVRLEHWVRDKQRIGVRKRSG